MSSVRMCDRCGAIFSELRDGWQAFTANTVKRDRVTGKTYTLQAAMDACPECSIASSPDFEPPTPRLAGPPTLAAAATLESPEQKAGREQAAAELDAVIEQHAQPAPA